MWLFNKEKRLNAVENDVLELQKQLKTLKTRVDGLDFEYEALRNKVLRKIQSKRFTETAGDTETEKDIYNKVLVPEYGDKAIR